ncbi:unnamed protein product [Lactuca saligna]|uniref:Uncharacterized protein n=1 Tax=Lactuca saligna TaxID=75948 RepID=A0AA35YX85_LACSI|nr:unnamed protein product [Lactuca saligna]
MEFITQTYQKVDTNSKSIADIEKQIAQLAEQIRKREDDKFPSTTTVNPSHTQRLGKEHQVNQVITLRSGKKVDNKVSASTLDNDSDTEVIFDEKEELEKDFKPEKQKVSKGKNDSKVGEHGVEVNTAPYPSALEKPASFPFGKRGTTMEDMWDLFSQMPAKRSRVASSSSAARQPARQPEPNVPVAFDPQYQILYEHPDNIHPAVYEATHPITGFIAEYMVERPSFTGYNIVETFDRYEWGGVLDFNPTQIYVGIVREWMRTLRRVEVPSRSEELQLIGMVRTHDIVMTVQGIRDMFHVDIGYHLHDLENQPTEYRCIDARGVTLGHISFHVENGRHILRDSATNLTYTTPLGVGDEEPFIGDFQEDHQQQQGQAADTWMEGVDMTLADLTEQMRQYRYRAPAPVFYRSGDPSNYPPPSEYEHYHPPPATEESTRFEDLAGSIFGYPPPYPCYPP